MNDKEFTIVSTLTAEVATFDANTNPLEALTIDSTSGTVADGTVATTIENNKGSSLPSTGGIGTTICYVTGGALAIGAGVLLITKKRMKNED